MLTALLLIASIGLISFCTMSFFGGLYANRSALPMAGALFVALLLFGAFFG
jgi:uncharacterized membrane protein